MKQKDYDQNDANQGLVKCIVCVTMPVIVNTRTLSFKEILTQYVKVCYSCCEASLQCAYIAFCSPVGFCADSQHHGRLWILSGHQGASSLKRSASVCRLQTPAQTKLAARQ